jgi:hypothetical protein
MSYRDREPNRDASKAQEPWERGAPPQQDHGFSENRWPQGFEPHPLANIFPLIEPWTDEFKELVASIAAHGLIEQIVMLDGMVLDGRNRVRGCQRGGVPIPSDMVRQFGSRPSDGKDPEAFVYLANYHRRHLNTVQRARIAWKRANADKQKQGLNSGALHDPRGTRAKQARQMRVSERTVASVAAASEKVISVVGDAMDRGRMGLTKAQEYAALTQDEQWRLWNSQDRFKYNPRPPPDEQAPKRPRQQKPATASLTQAWLDADEATRLKFMTDIALPWLDEYERRERA